MESLVIIIVWVLNAAISFWNARTAGVCWVEAKATRGWPRFMVWMACVQSAVGFTWCYSLLLAMGGMQFRVLRPDQAVLLIEMGYILIVPGILFSGIMIGVDSWIQAWRRNTLSNFALATYNTYANVHNAYGAIQGIGPVASDIFKKLQGSGSSKDQRDRALAALLIAVVLVCLFSGVFTTAAIVKHYAGSAVLPPHKESASKQTGEAGIQAA